MAAKTLASEFDFLQRDSVQAAKRLLGCWLIRQEEQGHSIVRIVETEAYDQMDVASHSYNGQTERTKIMFGPAGYLYVYFTYGMHYCANIVVGAKGYGAAVLIRAVEPLEGTAYLQNRRKKSGIELSNGPAKLCQALGIDTSLNGHNLHEAPLVLDIQPAVARQNIVTTTRIGISQAKDTAWRFYIKDNPYVSMK